MPNPEEVRPLTLASDSIPQPEKHSLNWLQKLGCFVGGVLISVTGFELANTGQSNIFNPEADLGGMLIALGSAALYFSVDG